MSRLHIRRDWRNRQRGQNAILDRGLATILATVAIVGALAAYFLFSGNSNAQAEQAQLSSIAAEVDNLYGSQSNYTGLTTTVIASSGALSPQWVVAGPPPAIVSVYRSPITLAPVNNPYTGLANGAWTLTLAAVPSSACVTLATTLVGSGELGLSINGAGAPAGPPAAAGASPLPTPAAAQAACNKGVNTLAFYLT